MTQRDLVVAAQRGSAAARENLVRAYLPLVYNVAGRALLEPHDIDDVVQETMLRVVRNLDTLRQPESVRSWILAIAVHQVGEAQRAAGARLAPLSDVPDSSTDFEELTILRLRLSGQRRQAAEAGRWLDADDRTVLALWWQEAAGQIGRDELAEALDATPAYAGVRVQRMRERLERGRALVAALDGRPRCDGLAFTADGWDGQPGVLWRKRLDRHVRDCAVCLRWSADPVPIERLLAGAAMLPVPAGLLDSVLAKVSLLGPTGVADPVSASASPILSRPRRRRPMRRAGSGTWCAAIRWSPPPRPGLRRSRWPA